MTSNLPAFVGRRDEVAFVRGTFARVLEGHGTIVFVAGEPGIGKSALLERAGAEAGTMASDLIVARGQGNAHVGVSDAYLPWKEVLWSLVGDTRRASRAPRGFDTVAALVTKVIFDVAPDIVGALIPFAGLGFKGLQSLLAQLKITPPETRPGALPIDQSRIFEQYFHLLRRLADQAPLLLLLDDFQWADTASCSLLFYLGRKLQGSRILVLCAYRPDEVVALAGGETLHLNRVVNELRRCGSHVLNLDWSLADARGRNRVEQFVDEFMAQACPGHIFPRQFLQDLAERTAGNPLFLSELVHWLVETGTIVQTDSGWTLRAGAPAFDALPERVEALVEQRVSLLTGELKRLLVDASVEGQDFTAQVLATLHGLDERGVLERLAEQLGKIHHLVEEEGERAVERNRILSLFRFRHRLMRDYLYHSLSESQKRVLHRQVGECLEALYEKEAPVVAPHLARHFEIARDYRKALHYATQVARAAGRSGAAREAHEAYQRALLLWTSAYGDPQAAGVSELAERLNLLREAGDVAEYLGELALAGTYHREAVALAERLGDARERLLALDNLGDVCRLQGDYDQAERYYKMIEPLVQGDPELCAELYCDLAELYVELLFVSHEPPEGVSLRPSDWVARLRAEAATYAERARALAAQGALPDSVRRAYQVLSEVARHDRDFRRAESLARCSLEVAEAHNLDRHALNTLGEIARLQGRLEEAAQYYRRFLEWAEKTGSGRERMVALNNLGIVCLDRGDLDGARCCFDEVLDLGLVIPHPGCVTETRIMKGILLSRQQQLDAALAEFRAAWSGARAGAASGDAAILLGLARKLALWAELDKARQVLELAERCGAAPEAVAEILALLPPQGDGGGPVTSAGA